MDSGLIVALHSLIYCEDKTSIAYGSIFLPEKKGLRVGAFLKALGNLGLYLCWQKYVTFTMSIVLGNMWV